MHHSSFLGIIIGNRLWLIVSKFVADHLNGLFYRLGSYLIRKKKNEKQASINLIILIFINITVNSPAKRLVFPVYHIRMTIKSQCLQDS